MLDMKHTAKMVPPADVKAHMLRAKAFLDNMLREAEVAAMLADAMRRRAARNNKRKMI